MVITIARDLRSFRLAVSTGRVFLYTPQARSVLVLDETTGRMIHKFDGHTKVCQPYNRTKEFLIVCVICFITYAC